MNIVNSINFKTTHVSKIRNSSINNYTTNLLIKIKTPEYINYDYTYRSVFIYKNVLNIFFPETSGNGVISGGSYINTTETVYDSRVDLYYGDTKIKTTYTKNGMFSFKNINDNVGFDIKATPINKDFNPRVVSNVKPVIDNISYRFIFYCNYDHIYKATIKYNIHTIVIDTKGDLSYNLDNAPTGMSINSKTGVITFRLSTIGTYNFAVNCSDSLLELTKSIPMEIEIIA